jgi:hypothetical protein
MLLNDSSQDFSGQRAVVTGGEIDPLHEGFRTAYTRFTTRSKEGISPVSRFPLRSLQRRTM